MTSLLVWVAAFVGSHFLLSSVPVRRPLVAKLGKKGFAALYSVVSFVTFGGMIAAYRGTVPRPAWSPPPAGRWVPLLVMPVALLFLVAGFSTPSATSAGQERQAAKGPRGILAVTRHPALTGFSLWALAHLAADGDSRVMTIAAGMLVLSVGGMFHIDARRDLDGDEAWRTFRSQTSRFPFLAMARGRTKLNFPQIGVKRVLVAGALYVAILYGHGRVFGASPYP